MKFNHRINFNGTYYAAGEDVPIEGVEEPKVEESAPEISEQEEPKPVRRRGRTARNRE